MDALKKMFESFGFENVQTYIQTGNVIFETKAKNSPSFESDVEQQLAAALGYRVEVFIRSLAELAEVVNQKHFQPAAEDTLHVVFLRAKASPAASAALKKFNSPADEFAVSGREVYNLRHDRDKSVFSNSFVEKICGEATTRNITTLRKILAKYS